ncbi:MAG: hypothetical protein ACK5K7_00560 [Bacilli bacterium]
MRSREEYTNQIHRLGRITNFIAVVLMVLVPIIISNVFDIPINFKMYMQYGFPFAVIFIFVGVAEVLAYTPILGASGSYLSFITGNIGNMKIPAAVSAQQAINAKKGTEEAEVASTMAIATSSFITVAVLTVGIFFMSFIAPILENPVLEPAFKNIMPALMGAFATPLVIANPKKAVVPVITVLLLKYISPMMLAKSVNFYVTLFLMVIVIIVALVYEYIKYSINKN